MKTYNCGFCQKEFKQKIDYLRHQTRKTPCISMAQIINNDMQKQQNDSNMSTLKTFYSKCFNILRDNEHLTGDKALRNLSYLLILKLLEPKLDEINFRDFDGYNFDENVDESNIDTLFKLTQFSYLQESKEDDMQSRLNAIWEHVLSKHPKTKDIFLEKKGFDIKSKNTYLKLIKEISKINFTLIEQDIQGEAYEDILKDTLTGKVLGQFFTPPILKKICVELVKPGINNDGTIETIFDLAMGTGGFLLTSIKYLEKEAKSKNINLDWKFISEEGLGGIEAEPDTFQLAKSNMLISTGQLFNNIHLGDSIRNTIEGKYDIVLANPPYGIKGLNYLEIENQNRDEYLPIKCNSAVPLFIQAIIYVLKINGRCAIVLPNGVELGGDNQDLVAIREYLMKTCDLKEVICLPAGIFTHTSIRTCIFYFIKKIECSSVLEIKINCSKKTGKETSRTYNFSKVHQTKSVKFYECNPDRDFKELKADVPIENIENNHYSLNYNDYIEEEKNEDTEEVKWMNLGDICEFLPKSKRQASYGKIEGVYPFFKSSMKVNTYVEKPDYDKESIIIGDGGNPNINYGTYFSTSDHCYILRINDKYKINLKFIYYFLLNNLNQLEKFYKGVAIKNISKSNIKLIKIPIPSLEKQKEVVSFCENNDRVIKKLEEEIEFNKKLSSQILNGIFKSSSIEELDSEGDSSDKSSSDEGDKSDSSDELSSE